MVVTVDLFTITAPGCNAEVRRSTLTAANGDTVYGAFTGKGTPTPVPGVISVVETMTITGGTGRFNGATGGFICQRLLSQVTGKTTGSFSGTISSPGSSNP